MCIVQDASFFLCKELIPGYLNGITGEYATPEGYFVDENECKNSKGKSNPTEPIMKMSERKW